MATIFVGIPGDVPDDSKGKTMTRRAKKTLMGLAILASLALTASAIAGAATSGSTQSSTTATTEVGQNGPGSDPGFTAADAPGTAAHESAEKIVTGEAAEKARRTALASVRGGKAGAVTGDFRNSGDYEVAVTKTDGSQVTVRLDGAFKVETHPGGPGAGIGTGDVPPGSQAPPSGQGAPYGQPPQAD